MILWRHIENYTRTIMKDPPNIIICSRKRILMCPCNLGPLVTHYYIVKLGIQGYSLFFFFLPMSTHNLCFQQNQGPHLNIQIWLNRNFSLSIAMTANQNQPFGQRHMVAFGLKTIPEFFFVKLCKTICSYKAINGNIHFFSKISQWKLSCNQRTNGPVNAHLISSPSKAQNIQNLEKIW